MESDKVINGILMKAFLGAWRMEDTIRKSNKLFLNYGLSFNSFMKTCDSNSYTYHNSRRTQSLAKLRFIFYVQRFTYISINISNFLLLDIIKICVDSFNDLLTLYSIRIIRFKSCFISHGRTFIIKKSLD